MTSPENKSVSSPKLWAQVQTRIVEKAKPAQGTNASSFDQADNGLAGIEHNRASWFHSLRGDALTIAGTVKLEAKGSFAGDESISGKARVKIALSKLTLSDDKAENASLRKEAVLLFSLGSALAFCACGDRKATVAERK